nr:hypothetical protein Itr_chr14CG12930 [Ipomoea trifida]
MAVVIDGAGNSGSQRDGRQQRFTERWVVGVGERWAGSDES